MKRNSCKKTKMCASKTSIPMNPTSSVRPSIASSNGVDSNQVDEDGTLPDFIYGGPFIKVKKPSPFLDTTTPINLQLQGTFKKSYAYYSLKEELPVMLTKIIDYLARTKPDSDGKTYIRYITKLKNDLMTNKKYDLLTVGTPEAERWNEWINMQDNKHYFTNTWLFTECYLYRRLREGCELVKSLENFDPFEEQKKKLFTDTLEQSCVVAEKLITMLPPSDKDKRKQDFMTLVKICLWANKFDVRLSMANNVEEKAAVEDLSSKEQNKNTSSSTFIDPFQMVIDCKDKLLVDDSGKAADAIATKAENTAKAIEGNTTFKFQCSCHRLATLAGMPVQNEPVITDLKGVSGPTIASKGSPPSGTPAAKGSPPPSSPAAEPAEEVEEERPKIPCPAKMVIPQAVIFDIVMDNAGYELVTDLCFAHFLVAQKIAQKVRFHVKKIPWFVSDATPKDIEFVVSSCRGASYNRSIPPDQKPEPADGSEPPPPDPPRIISSEALKEVAERWQQYFDDGTFIVMCDDFWTSPIPYKDMKKYEYNLYRKLQYAIGVMFKGDLNYRKLLEERNFLPTAGFEPSLQGFIPTPILAVRTVKTELICGLPKGKNEQLLKLDERWMSSGEYGVIQFCAKAEPLKVSEKPCLDYGDTCFGTTCAIHTDM